MSEKTKKKNWFRRHWVISIILGIILISFIGGLFIEESSNTNQESQNKNTKEYVQEDLYTLITLFVGSNSPYTEIQKEENFKQYKNKWIKGTGIVGEVEEVIVTGTPLIRIINPENQYTYGATIYFEDSEKDKLLEVNKYKEIQFEGRIEQYNSLMGLIIKEAKLSEDETANN